MNKKHIKNDIIIVNILKFWKYVIIYEEEKMKSKFYIKALLIILLAVSLITIPNISNATERTANDLLPIFWRKNSTRNCEDLSYFTGTGFKNTKKDLKKTKKTNDWKYLKNYARIKKIQIWIDR